MPFDDDDNPNVAAGPPSAGGVDGAAAAEEAMEDEMPDYKLFMSMFDKKGVSSKTIRKGEKDFESHGTRAQDGVLETSRRALEEVLSYTRIHRGDGWVRGWYVPDFWASGEEGAAVGVLDLRHDDGRLMLRERVVVVEHERGSWMKDIGRSVPAGINSSEAQRPGVGRLWLLPEEALHMVERGTLDLWWPHKELGVLLQAGTGPDDYDVGVPLSLEAAYSLLLGEDDGERGKVSLPRYQVFTHLKRGGFHVLRAPDEQRQAPPDTKQTTTHAPGTTLLHWLLTLVGWGGEARPQPPAKLHSFGPLVSPGLYRAYKPIYEQLSLLPRHVPQRSTTMTSSRDDEAAAAAAAAAQDPYKVFFHVWKAGGAAPFAKRNPPPPTFRIAVADTGLHGVPTLEQAAALLASTPLDDPLTANPAWKGPGRLYQRLKHGHRNVLVAVVDRGLVNYMRFGEGAFGEERLYERHDVRRDASGGGKRGGGRGRGRGGRGRGRGRGR